MDPKLLMRKKHELLMERQKILDAATKEERGYTATERSKVKDLQRRVEELDEQLTETLEIERQRAGIPRDQPPIGEQTGDPLPGTIHATRGAEKPRFVDVKTGREVRTFLPTEDWRDGREYHLPDGIRPEELSLARMVRGLVNNDWRGAEAEQRTMSEITGSLGGWLIPSPIADRIIQVARNKLRVIQAGALTIGMEYPELTLAKVTEEPVAYWIPENAPAKFTDVNFAPIKLRAKKIAAMSKASEELIQDAGNLEAILTDSLAFALAKEIDLKALTGSGTGEPLGLLNTDGVGLTDLAAAAVDIDSFLDVIFTLVGLNVTQERLAAIYNADLAKAIAKLKAVGSGVYLEPNAPPAWQGLRKLTTAQIPTAAAKTNSYVGDYSDLYVGIRQDLALEISRSASDSEGNSAFQRSQVWFRVSQRIDTLVVRPSSFHVLKDAGV